MRTEMREHKLYKFEELSEKAKQYAIGAYWASDFDSEAVLDEAVRMGSLLGIEIDTSTRRGSNISRPHIYFSGFWSYGCGVWFEGTYRYRKGSVAAIKAECVDEKLIRIAKGLKDVQRKHFYALCARCREGGLYRRTRHLEVDVTDYYDVYRDIGDAENEVTQLLRDFADWIYEQLEAEYEYQTSEEHILEACKDNGYEFDENGRMQ